MANLGQKLQLPLLYRRACVHVYNKFPEYSRLSNVLHVSSPMGPPYIQQVRHRIGFMGTRPAKHLWSSVLSVSNAGSKKGRRRRLGRPTDLNRGQMLGTGRLNYRWPGLNMDVDQKTEDLNNSLKPRKLDTHKNYAQDLADIRKKGLIVKKRTKRLHPLERGFTSSRVDGQNIGKPDVVGEYTWDGMECRVMFVNAARLMSGSMGRVMQYRALVCCGNGNGLIGYAFATAKYARTAIKNAKNRAGRKLLYVDRYNNNPESFTVFHNIHHREHCTSFFIQKKQAGYGLVGHRLVKTICKLVGITDLYCKTENSLNHHYVIQGFINAIIQQETHQQIADRLGRHVVEYRHDMDRLPVAVASPAVGKSVSEPLIDPDTGNEPSFDLFFYPEGRVPLDRSKKKRFYHDFPGYKQRMKNRHRDRNQAKCRQLRDAGYWGDRA